MSFACCALELEAKAPVKPLSGAERKQAAIARAGGLCAQPGSQKGCVRIVNAQSVLPLQEIEKVCGVIAKQDEYKVEVRTEDLKKCPVEYAKVKSGAGVVIVVVNDEKSSSLMVSPDEHWAVVNIKSLDEGLKTAEARDKFYASRVRKQIIRAFVLATTGNGSQYTKNFFYAKKISDFDLYNEFVPADSAGHCKVALAEMGVTPVRYANYRAACREGWAAAPTNDVQKAIWNELHEIPTEPMVIKPEKHPAE